MLKEAQTTNPQIQAYRDLYSFDPLHRLSQVSVEARKKEMKPKLFRTNVNFMDGIYSGQFSESPLLPDGFGIFMQNKSGAVYEGERRQGLRSGHGRLIQDNGLIYEGQWSENKPHGFGCVRYPPKPGENKCDVFSGIFVMSSRMDSGTLFEQ